MEKLYYSISEAAKILDENISLVRYWTTVFQSVLKPHRTAKGNRQYTEGDIEILKQIHFLVKEQGMTLEGAEKQLKGKKSGIDKSVKALDSLKAIRSQLVEIKKSL